MRHFSLALVLISAMVVNLVADLNFPDGSADGEAWDSICGIVALISVAGLILSVLIDILKDLDAD